MHRANVVHSTHPSNVMSCKLPIEKAPTPFPLLGSIVEFSEVWGLINTIGVIEINIPNINYQV